MITQKHLASKWWVYFFPLYGPFPSLNSLSVSWNVDIISMRQFIVKKSSNDRPVLLIFWTFRSVWESCPHVPQVPWQCPFPPPPPPPPASSGRHPPGHLQLRPPHLSWNCFMNCESVDCGCGGNPEQLTQGHWRSAWESPPPSHSTSLTSVAPTHPSKV